MAETPISKEYGQMIDLGLCRVGRNLNLLTARGFAPLDVLAAVSAPDVYDQVDNPTGTQRDLKPKHARECFDYALDSLSSTPEDDPRFFPDIILNARDANVVEIYEPDDDGTLLDLDSFSDEADAPEVVGIRIRVSDLEYPKPTKSPQISRVDGNHRLSHTDDVLDERWSGGDGDEEDPEFPPASFSLLLSLDQLQEAKLFRDINGEHEGMETAHLDTIRYRITEHAEMKLDGKLRPLWMAHKLAEEGRAFEGMVFLGGSKKGLKKSLGSVPPIKINALKTTINTQLKAAPTVMQAFGEQPDLLLELVDRYWKCVRDVFPEAWQDKRKYILLQSIGLGGFAKFGGTVLERAYHEAQLAEAEMRHYVAPVADEVSLLREHYQGIAGAGGADFIAKKLIAAADQDQVIKQKAMAKLAASVEEETATALDDEPPAS